MQGAPKCENSVTIWQSARRHIPDDETSLTPLWEPYVRIEEILGVICHLPDVRCNYAGLLIEKCKAKTALSIVLGQSCEKLIQGRIGLTLRRLMSYIYGAPILDVSRSHTTTQHSR